jgi:ribonuclease BN (tRNA processing enzyme)
MLNFIGIGSAFNTALGNNGAFVKSSDDKKLFLIDCGEVTFDRLKKFGVLDGVEEIHLLITHFHPDHVGSLGSLAFYMFYSQEPFRARVTFYTPDTKCLLIYLKATGVREEHYYERHLEDAGVRSLIDMGENMGRLFITPILMKHDKRLTCYGYYLEFVDLNPGKRIYYSGDSKEIPQQAIEQLENGNIEIMYQDVGTHDYDDAVHLSLKKLNELIAQDNATRNKIWCMHLDKDWNWENARESGFNSVSVYTPGGRIGD